jgi:SAM-dependent methyltransferase
MDLTEYRACPLERQRTSDLLRLMPIAGRNALDIGAGDGYFSLLMADRFERVTALELDKPKIDHPKIHCVKGDAANMQFADGSFDLVFCAEVLDHVNPSVLQKICQEIERISNQQILIGVPYKQDLRVGRTTCYSCQGFNPPWGHVNSFNEQRCKDLFPHCKVEAISFVGVNRSKTNWLSAALMDFAGNPYGTYEQQQTCIHCGRRLIPPPRRNIVQLVATEFAFWCRKITELFSKRRGIWMHIALRKISDVPR